MKKLIQSICLVVCILTLPACAAARSENVTQASISLLVPKQVRGAWVPTVKNMDWPSKPGLSVAQQKAEALAYLDRAKEIGLNTLIFQVRPHGDAFFESKLEPWSYYLSGKEGESPGYDPLTFWLKEAHARGIRLHAWFNPFRAAHPAANKGERQPTAALNKLAPFRHQLKKGYAWYEPSAPVVQKHVLAVIADVLKRYDVDGIHIDDYFYPYRELCPKGGFPDQNFYAAYQEQGGKYSKPEWRRQRMNDFVKSLSKLVKKYQAVEFSVSPFGIWKSGVPKEIVGTSSYHDLGCDSRLWLQQGWVDFMVPQLYWPRDRKGQQFELLLNWWGEQVPKNKKAYLLAGLATWRTAKEEIAAQKKLVQENQHYSGYLHFRMSSLMPAAKIDLPPKK